MSDLIRLTVVTDNAASASLAIFGFRLQTAQLEAPWCRFVDKAWQIPDIPDQAAVMAIWFDQDVLMEIRWFNERHKRPFNDNWCDQAERVNDWLAKRQARDLALIAESMSSSAQLDAVQTMPAAAVPQPATQPRTMWS